MNCSNPDGYPSNDFSVEAISWRRRSTAFEHAARLELVDQEHKDQAGTPVKNLHAPLRAWITGITWKLPRDDGIDHVVAQH